MQFPFKNFLVRLIYMLIDTVCIYSAIFFACIIRKGTLSFPVTFQNLILDPINPFRIIFLLWILSVVFCASANKLYETRREVFEGIEIWMVIKCVSLSSLVVIVAIYALKIHHFPRTIWFISAFFMIFFLSLWRIAKRIFVEHLVNMGYNNLNILIIGAGKVGVSLAEEIKSRPGLGIKIAGFLDDFKKNDQQNPEIKILGKISDFAKIAKKEFIHKVFITIHNNNEAFLNLLQHARDFGIAVRVVPQAYDLITGELSRYNIGFIPILEYSDGHDIRKQIGKRVFDFFISLILLIVLFPLFVVIGIIIMCESRGPALYTSKRYGRRGQIFHMYKFRTMVKDADKIKKYLNHKNEADGPIFKIRNDPRITKIGRFLRRYSLDELPQLINVLIGDMSLVGPRPLPTDQIQKEDLRQLERLEVRPGITGLWQIRGRSDVSFSRLLKWDMWYINNWSFWLDFNILLQTIPVVLKGKGAY